MATTIKFKRGTRANLNSLASSNGLEAGEPILITDEDRIAICTSDSAYEEFAKVSEVVGGGMTNPMTTAGDMIYAGSSGIPTRLPKGTDDQYLKLVSGAPTWAAGGGGSGDEVDFTVTRTENTTGSQTLYNPARREYTLLDITNAATTYTITLSPKPNSGGTATITNVEHYVTVKNTAAAAKTLVIRLETAGQKLISEGLTAVPLAISGIYEIGFIWLTRGADTICVITKTTLLTEVTQS
jgi:hypothetical protein